MQAVIYVRNDKDIPIYEQFNVCAEFAKRYGYSIEHKVLDFEGNIFYEAINKVIVEHYITALIIYDKGNAFDSEDDYIFYRIYLEKLGKKLISAI
jgi:hypothetical protein